MLRKAFRTNTAPSSSTVSANGNGSNGAGNGTSDNSSSTGVDKETELGIPESHQCIANQTFFGLENVSESSDCFGLNACVSVCD